MSPRLLTSIRLTPPLRVRSRHGRGDDAPDGGLGRRGDDHGLGEAARRLGRGRRDRLHSHHRQGGCGDPRPGQRPARASPRGGGPDRSGGDAPCRDRSGGEARSGPSAGGIERGRRGARAGPGYGHGAGATPAADERSTEPEEPPAADERPAEPERSGFYSPVVRRIADKHGIDLSRVEGTGIGGRVRKRDVLAYIEAGGEREAEPAVAEPAETGERPLHRVAVPARGAGPGDGQRRTEPAVAPAGDGAPPAPERREPMTPMRKRIAEHMVESRRTAAHCTTIVEVDMSSVAARRRELKEAMARRDVRSPTWRSSPGPRSTRSSAIRS